MNGETLYQKALRALNRGNWIEAFQYLVKSIQIYPDYIPSYQELAQISYAMGHRHFTRKVVERALMHNPQDPDCNFLMGNLLYVEGKCKRAIAYYMKAQNKNGYPSPETFYNLGLCYRSLGDTEKALACFKLAVETSPEMEEAKLALGCCLLELGELEEAEDALWSAVDINPQIPEAYHQLGLVYAQKREWEEAINLWEEALILEPNRHETLREIGWAYHMLGERELALEYLEASVRANPDNMQARFDLSILYLHNMQIREAMEHLEAILQRFPHNKLAERYLKEAKRLGESLGEGR